MGPACQSCGCARLGVLRGWRRGKGVVVDGLHPARACRAKGLCRKKRPLIPPTYMYIYSLYCNSEISISKGEGQAGPPPTPGPRWATKQRPGQGPARRSPAAPSSFGRFLGGGGFRRLCRGSARPLPDRELQPPATLCGAPLPFSARRLSLQPGRRLHVAAGGRRAGKRTVKGTRVGMTGERTEKEEMDTNRSRNRKLGAREHG